MPIIPLALPAQSNQSEHPHGGIAALINAYGVPNGEGQKASISVRAAAGLDSLVTLATTGGVRGMLEVDGVLSVVAGRTLYQVDSGGSAVVIGGIPSDGYVGMARNQRGAGAQTIVVCDGLGWVVVGGTMTRITDGDLPPPIDVCVINRRAIFASADGRMHASEIDDARSVDGLDTAEAEAAPDGLFRVLGRGSDLIAIGSRSTEVWSDTGAQAFGFSRANVINVGAIGPSSVTRATLLGEVVTDSVAWCATDRDGRFAGVILLSGYTPAKISPTWIDRKIDRVADKSSIVASSWIERGRSMIGWRLPDTTVVYDTSTRLWHERQSRTGAGLPTTWRVGRTAVINGRVIAGDADQPRLYWLDPDVYDEDDDEMVMTVRTPPVNAFPGRMEMNRVFLDVLPGVGLVSGAAENVSPEVSMRLSRDGETWESSRTRLLGAQGARLTRVDWPACGTWDQATLEFSCSAAVAREMYSAAWDGKVIKP